jgi:hypothetical protein
MAELVDALDSKSGYRKVVQVRFLFWAQAKNPAHSAGFFYGHDRRLLQGTIKLVAKFVAIVRQKRIWYKNASQ